MDERNRNEAVTELSDLLSAILRGGLNGTSVESLLADLCAWGGAALMTWGAVESSAL